MPAHALEGAGAVATRLGSRAPQALFLCCVLFGLVVGSRSTCRALKVPFRAWERQVTRLVTLLPCGGQPQWTDLGCEDSSSQGVAG